MGAEDKNIVRTNIRESGEKTEALFALHNMRRLFCNKVKHEMEAMEFPEDMISDVEKAAGEAITNTRHAFNENELTEVLKGDNISAEAVIRQDRVCITITDKGPQGVICERCIQPLDESGNGIKIMKTLTDFSIIANEPGHHSIMLTKTNA